MEPQVSHPKLPMILAIGITAIIFGLGGYVIASMANNDTTTDLTVTTGSTATTTSSASPTSKTTAASSETYTNTKYKFSVKHPSDWKVTEDTNSGDDGKGGITISFAKGTSATKPQLSFAINPPGRGAAIPEFKYDIKYNNGTMTVNNKTTPESAMGSPTKGVVHFDDPSDASGNSLSITINSITYYIYSSNILTDEDLNTIVDIVASFKAV